MTKEQVGILDEIEVKLFEMRRVAKYALEYKLSSIETEELNDEFNLLTNEITVLEKQLYPFFSLVMELRVLETIQKTGDIFT